MLSRSQSIDSPRQRTTSPCSTVSRPPSSRARIRVLQRGLRRARTHRGASGRTVVPRPRTRARLSPAGLDATAFLRSDELPGDAAVGYLHADGPRSNVFHLPVRGSGDGGIYSTAADIRTLWTALFDGRIIAPDRVAQMVEPVSDVPTDERRYGRGLWLHATSDIAMLVGHDAGVSFWTAHDPASSATWTVISNTSEGAWELVEPLWEQLPG